MNPHTPANEPIPITLLTGFLGSGKTTLLSALIQQAEMARTLIIINEFGVIGLDHLLITQSTEETIVEMSSGCLCCTIRSDLVKTLRDITWRFAREGQRQFDRVIIETTGLADPVPIIHTLITNEFITARYRLDGVVTTVDLVAGEHTLNTHTESVKQAAVADLLVFTKADIASANVKKNLQSRLSIINPSAHQVFTANGKLAPSLLINLGLDYSSKNPFDLQRWLNTQAYKQIPDKSSDSHDHEHGHTPNRHNDHICAFCFQFDRPIAPSALEDWLLLILPLMGHKMLRIKGILNLEGSERPLVVHGVQHFFHPSVQLESWPDNDRRSKLVFITHDLDRSVIEATLREFMPFST